MPVAKDVYGVIAGEATSGTPEQRWNDMVNIASVIVNRANELGVPVDQVVANSSEFNSFNKSLPPGASEYTDMAKQAMDYVTTNGPVNNATFYSTPNTTQNLPSGLQPVTSTTGHEFFTDPQFRAINTANGYVAPKAYTSLTPSADSVPVPYSPTAAIPARDQVSPIGLLSQPSSLAGYFDQAANTPAENAINKQMTGGLAGLLSNVPQVDVNNVPADIPNAGILGAATLSPMNTQPTGWNRPFPADQTVSDHIQQAVTDTLGPDYSIQTTSGTEGSGPQYGSNRHKTGLAEDITITDPTGHMLSWTDPADLTKMQDLGQALAAQNQANLGIGYLNSPHMMHVDYVDPSNFVKGQDSEWGVIGNAMAPTLDNARTTGLMPASYYEKANQSVIANNVVPTPSPGLLSDSNYVNSASVTPVTSSPLGLPNVSSFQDMAQAGPVNTGLLSQPNTGIYSPLQKSLDASASAQLSAMNPTTSVASTPTTSAMPSYAQEMASVAPQATVNQGLLSATQAPMFSQALAASASPLSVTTTPASTATIAGPTTTSAVDQQQQQAASTAQAPQSSFPANPALSSFPAAPKTGLLSGLSGLVNKDAVAGGLLGGVVAGPLGAGLGGLLGYGLSKATLGGQPFSINNVGTGLNNISSAYSGQNPGLQATANNGGTVTSLGGGWSVYTNPMGAQTAIGPNGEQASYFGSKVPSTNPGSSTSNNPTSGMSTGLF